MEEKQVITIHINIAVAIVKEVLPGKDPTATIKSWYENAAQFAKFLDHTIERRKFKALLDIHLECTLNEAVFIIKAKYPESLVEYQICLTRIKKLSNYISLNIH